MSTEEPSRTVRPDRLRPRAPRPAQSTPPERPQAPLPIVGVETASAIDPVGKVGDPGPDGPPAELALDTVLGAGGMGRVLGGTQRSLGREVAVKVLHADAGSREELVREARIVGRVEHPNVVPVHLLARTPDGEPVLVMKRIEGVRWLDLVRDPSHAHFGHLPGAVSAAGGPAPDRLEAHLEIFEAVCHAVAGAHERGIVHRDVKLENVMVGRFGEVYLTDWGIALDRAGHLERESAPFAGTPTYAAPEMMAGDERAMDERTDVYLLGATLHHALTGHPRHSGESLLAILGSAAESAPPSYDAAIAPELGEILRRAMHQDPARRFQSVLSLRDAVRAHRRHRHAHALLARASRDVASLERAITEGALEGTDKTTISALVALEETEREWPDAPALRPLRASLSRAVLEVQLRRRALASAREALAALTESGEARPTDRERVEALAEEIAKRDASAAELERIEEDLDLGIAQAVRRRLFATMTAIMVPLGTAALVYQALGGAVSSATAAFVVAVGGTAAFAAFIVLHRATLLANRANRDVVMTVGAAMGFVVLHRAVGMRVDLDVTRMLALDLTGVAAIIVLGTGLAMPRLAWAAGVVTLGALASLVVPDRSPAVFALTVPIFLIVAFRAFSRAGRSR